METILSTPSRVTAERKFYTAMSFAILISVFLGFARSFFLRPLFPDHASPSEPIFYVHGTMFTLWILLFSVQVALISRGNLSLHRNMGVFGGFLAAAIVVLGIMGAVTAATRPTGFIGVPVPPLQFMAVPFFDMILFPLFVALALVYRNNSQSHKRWMLLATFNLITAAIARWPIVGDFGPLAYFGVTDLFIVALAVWDFRSSGRLHRVTLFGGLALIISQPLRLAVSGTEGWLSFAGWITS